MNNELAAQSEALAERITESSHTWPGPLMEQMRFGQIPDKPRWIQQAVSGILTAGAVEPIYIGHTIKKAGEDAYHGTVTAVTDSLIVTVEINGDGVTTLAQPLSAVTAVEIVSVDSAFNAQKDWPVGLSFKAHMSGDPYAFPVSDDPSEAQVAEAQAVLRAVLAAIQQ